MMRTLSRRIHAGAGAALIAAALAGCGSAGDAGAGAGRLDLGIVTLSARIGDDVVPSAGAVIDADRGLIVTTAHTVWGATSLKVTTGLAVLHGRIVARDACDNLALVEVQPRLPGLVEIAPASASALGDGTAEVVRRAPGVTVAAGRELVRESVRAGGTPASAPSVPTSPSAVPLSGAVPAEASGAPVLDAEDRLVGIAQVVDGSDGGPAAMVPWATIDARIRELRPGPETVYVGWRQYYRCTPGLHAHARAAHPGYEAEDARLTSDVPVSRLPGSAVEDG